MERKEFKSKLFSKKIKVDDLDYWFYLYADVLYRLKQLNDLNCPCSFCLKDKVHYENLLEKMLIEGHIKKHPKAYPISGKGDCGRRLGPIA